MHDDELSRLISRQASYHKAGDRVRAQILSRIALEAASGGASGGVEAQDRAPAADGWAIRRADVPRRDRLRAWRLLARRVLPWQALAGFGIGASLTALLMGPMGLVSLLPSDAIEAELVDQHVQSLSQGPLIEVASSDRHTVKPWFQGKLDYAPLVLDAAGMGCPLQGGRLDTGLRHRPTAVLVYQCGRHVVNLFTWPDTRWRTPASLTVRGFHLKQWHEGGMQYWLVSDMDMPALERFSQWWLDSTRAAPPPPTDAGSSPPPPP